MRGAGPARGQYRLGTRGVFVRARPAVGVCPQRGVAQCVTGRRATYGRTGEPLPGRTAVLRPRVHAPGDRGLPLPTPMVAHGGSGRRAVGAPLAVRPWDAECTGRRNLPAEPVACGAWPPGELLMYQRLLKSLNRLNPRAW